jgi:hypothetical protein
VLRIVRTGGVFRVGDELTRAASRRPPICPSRIGARTEGYTYDAKVWDLSIVQGIPFPVPVSPNSHSLQTRRDGVPLPHLQSKCAGSCLTGVALRAERTGAPLFGRSQVDAAAAAERGAVISLAERQTAVASTSTMTKDAALNALRASGTRDHVCNGAPKLRPHRDSRQYTREE